MLEVCMNYNYKTIGIEISTATKVMASRNQEEAQNGSTSHNLVALKGQSKNGASRRKQKRYQH